MFPENFVFVLFGATGDLAYKKLLPALYQAVRFNPELIKGHFICLGRSASNRDDYLQTVKHYLCEHSTIAFDEKHWQNFIQKIIFLKVDVDNDADFDALKTEIDRLNAAVKIYYLSTSPKLFTSIVTHLKRTNLHDGDARLVLEKPLGHDLQSAQNIHKIVSDAFDEKQIYRIDHYLGKESVQNLMAVRFGNRLLEPLWNRVHIRSVQITLAEKIGIESRGLFYDSTGAMRDMVQNHLMQLLCFIAMEPPYNLSPDAIRDEKLKVLRSIIPSSPALALKNCVMGQYISGMMDGQNVCGYRQEHDVNPNSMTETYTALKLYIENWRWTGVPFYLRTGKRLNQSLAQIVIHFRSVPHRLFTPPVGLTSENRLVLNLQPNDEMRLYMAAKPAGNHHHLQSVSLNMNFAEQMNQRRPTAYERLLCDIIKGDLSLFVRYDELTEAWHKISPFLDLQHHYPDVLKFYTAGSWGVSDASALLRDKKARWFEDELKYL